ncbi:hypothetical protein [Edaphobacter dinghuensis]|uniref:Uncharacterized protein n=2 Tax=Edaphobacter dinghuensis TaxID=1560005 RepID=A0A917HJ40_9BACT|nr:hypothetical protein [Edaphobacter dinghuensis]GGG81305.1 hypothetical protein GCM10011585_25970 [Edaphobacter dinghuensis]
MPIVVACEHLYYRDRHNFAATTYHRPYEDICCLYLKRGLHFVARFSSAHHEGKLLKTND